MDIPNSFSAYGLPNTLSFSLLLCLSISASPSLPVLKIIISVWQFHRGMVNLWLIMIAPLNYKRLNLECVVIKLKVSQTGDRQDKPCFSYTPPNK